MLRVVEVLEVREGTRPRTVSEVPRLIISSLRASFEEQKLGRSRMRERRVSDKKEERWGSVSSHLLGLSPVPITTVAVSGIPIFSAKKLHGLPKTCVPVHTVLATFALTSSSLSLKRTEQTSEHHALFSRSNMLVPAASLSSITEKSCEGSTSRERGV